MGPGSQRDEDLREVTDLIPTFMGSVQPGVGRVESLPEDLGDAGTPLVVGVQVLMLELDSGVGA
jgi:hypothetical protein